MNETKTTTISTTTPLLAAGLVFLGAILFSTKAIFVKLAYRFDIDSISLLALRMLFALPFFLFISWWNKRRTPQRTALSRRDWVSIILLGFAGYYLASLLDFLGLRHIGAGMERLILFVYPTLVLLISALVYRQPVLRKQYLALILTYVGIAVAFAQGANLGEGNKFWWGALLIFGSALSYAIYLVGSGRLLPRLGTLRYTSLTMTVAAIAILAHHGLMYQWDLFDFPVEVYQLSLLMAIFATVLPAFLISEGIRIIGSSNASIIGSVGPISTIILAYIFLNEQFGIYQWGGTLLVIGGVLMISLHKGRP
ncbi:MAG: permease [Saprospiraceae bacterium]|nr:MAG: permease [Saprospiraceae bacterium]